MAKAGLEMALYDLRARLANKPLYRIYGGQHRAIPAGISLGIEKTIDLLIKRIERALQKGLLPKIGRDTPNSCGSQNPPGQPPLI